MDERGLTEEESFARGHAFATKALFVALMQEILPRGEIGVAKAGRIRERAYEDARRMAQKFSGDWDDPAVSERVRKETEEMAVSLISDIIGNLQNRLDNS